MIPRGILAWHKNKKVERTSPESKNHYKVTYWNGKEKWTDQYPGSGKPSRREERLWRRKQNRPSIKDAKAKLKSAVDSFVSGDSDAEKLRGVVEDTMVHLGRETAKQVIREFVKTQKEGAEGKKKEALGIIREKLNDKVRRKKAYRAEKVAIRMTLAAIGDRIVASEVTRILAAQIKAALYQLRTAIAHALPERTWVPDGIKEISADRVDFRFKAMKGIRGDSDVSVGATVKYDAGSDTYIFTPFIVAGGMQFWGEPSSDFYVEDFGDVSKVEYIFEKAKRKLPAHIEL